MQTLPFHRGEVGCPASGYHTQAASAQTRGVRQAAGFTAPADAPRLPWQNTSVRIERNTSAVAQYAVDQAHAECFNGDPFPSAAKCGVCHPGQYREWSVSPHAYAQLSPVFNAMSNKLIKLNNGTLGDFCIRCHTPAGMAQSEPIVMSNMDRPASSREGVTCVVCHRMNQAFGKGSGRQALVPGDIHAPIYGPIGNDILAQVLADPEKYGLLKTEAAPGERAHDIHREVVPFFQLTTAGFCGSCHDVFAPNGFRLEDAFSEFKSSPAARQKQQSCQDCHMGVEPGVASGFSFAPAAKIGNATTPPRKRTNHMMVGPDYSIVHPGLFPHNPKAVREETERGEPTAGLATMREWLLFNYKAGWGTVQFERNIPPGYKFPQPWADASRRFRARDVLNEQFQLLSEATAARHQLLSTGYRLGEIVADSVDDRGIQFRILVYNGTDGHGVPTGFDAERPVFLRVTVLDRDGTPVFISGDLDPNGDLRDSHSFYVHNGELPLDRYLFSLQTKFITRNVRGGEREQILNVPYSLDPLPYVRPEVLPFTIAGRPQGARKHKQNIEVEGGRWARYSVGSEQLTGRGPYYASVQIIAGMVPVNLVHEVSSVGFDYDMSARQVADAVVAGHMVLHKRSAVFRLHE
ncbi:MAG: hypothetical protein HYS13_15890 [Planctomycetia bacterium]|nr:hypothetical protein [Planctomycetia bacterium]